MIPKETSAQVEPVSPDPNVDSIVDDFYMDFGLQFRRVFEGFEMILDGKGKER